MKVSAVGMGCEYVWHADEETTAAALEAAVAAGVNYFDIFAATPSTREYYGRTLKKYRDKIYLAAHLGAAEINGQYMKTRDMALCRQFIQEFYDKLETEYADVLFLHNCDQLEDYQTIMNGGMYNYALELKSAGKARYIGISTHSTRIALEAVKSGKTDVLMFPVNPLFNLLPQDIADFRMKGRKMERMSAEEKAVYPTKEELYTACAQRGIPIVAMKPFAGGNILKDHEGGLIKGLINLTPVQCISYVHSFQGVDICPVPGVRAGDCVHCESCTERCPFGIDASENMRRTLSVFGS